MLLRKEQVSNDDLVNALLLWCLHHAIKWPERTTVGQVAEAIEAAAAFRASGGGTDDGMVAFLEKLEAAAEEDEAVLSLVD